MNTKLFFIIFITLFTFTAFANTEVGTFEIHDGNTVSLYTKSGKKRKIRLYGIDAPELTQDYGQQSRQHLEKLLKNKKVTYKSKGKDIYQRELVILFANNKDISLQMVKNGYAWHYKQYVKSKELENAQRYAKSKKIGLWSKENPEAPWTFRQKQKGTYDASKEPIFRIPIDNIYVCLNIDSYKIILRSNGCPKNYITIVGP